MIDVVSICIDNFQFVSLLLLQFLSYHFQIVLIGLNIQLVSYRLSIKIRTKGFLYTEINKELKNI